MIRTLMRLKKKGTLDKLLRSGLLSSSVPSYIETYTEYRRALKGSNKTKAVLITAKKLRRSERYVYKVIKTLRDD